MERKVNSKRSLKAIRTLKLIFIFLCIWFVAHELIIIIDGLKTQPVKSKYAIIFGNKVNIDGSLSNRLKARLDKALDLYNDSLVEIFFVSGGLGKEGHYEARVMANYLIANGIPEEIVKIDDFGNTTWLTALNFKNMVPHCQSVIVVTQYYHISRAKLACKKAGICQVSDASPNYFEWRDLYSLFREFFSYYKYLITY